MNRARWCGIVIALGACEGSLVATDAGVDAAASDAGTSDARPTDSATLDIPTLDTGTSDTAAPETGPIDANGIDARGDGPRETAVLDTSVRDTSVIDTRVLDARDATTVDTAVTPTVCTDQCHYVRSGASGRGDGTDWANAYDDLPSALTRGDVYFVASGRYSAHDFDDAHSGAERIIVRKATAADHGTSVGWSDAFGAAAARFSGEWTFTRGFYTLDGVTGGGPTSWESGHGFVVEGSISAPQFIDNGSDDIEVLHTEIDAGQTGPSDVRAVLLYGMDGFRFAYTFIHDAGCDMFSVNEMNRFTIEYSKVARNRQDAAGCHGDLIEYQIGDASGFVIRYNYFEDIVGSYAFGSHGPTIDGYEIYGNIFRWTVPTFFGNGLVGCLSSDGELSNVRFYNNTLSGEFGGLMAFGILRGTGNEAANNIWHRTGSTSFSIGFGGAAHDHNSFYNIGSMATGEDELAGDPFVDRASEDFRLSGPSLAGRSLASPYATDMTGAERGADGTFDRGALEHP